MFEGALEKLNIPSFLPRSDPETVPVTVDNDTYVTGCQIIIPDYDVRTETYYGPFWDFSNDKLAIGTYAVKTKQIWEIQDWLRQQASSNRYAVEIGGTKTTIQGLQVSLDTSREGRAIFLQKYSLMGDTDVVNWKFPEGWVTLTKQELAQCIDAGAAHIQATFDWEKSKDEEISGASTVDELKQIDISNVPNQN
jgi:hypothetical protein